MSKQYPGGFIIKNPTTPTTSSAPGMWTLEQASYYIKQGIWPLPPTIDPYFNYVTTLLHGDGTNAAQNNTFIDSSTNAYSVTRNGSTTQGTFTPFGANWSNYFGGSSAVVNRSNNTALAMGTGDFTIEFWMNAPSTGVQVVYDTRLTTSSGAGGLDIYIDTGVIYVYGGASTNVSLVSSAYTTNQWNHIAVVRSGSSTGNVKLYINGALVSTYGSADTSNYSLGYLAIGAFYNPSLASFYTGYLSNLRVVKGTAVYTTTFTPSTTPLTAISGTSLLTCQSNRFVDNSTNAFALTTSGTPSIQRFSPFAPAAAYSTSAVGGSMYFNGSTDYLTIPLAAYAFGTGAFTLEAWVYIQSVAAFNEVFYGSVSGGALDELQFGVQTGQTIGWETNNSISGSGGFVPLNTWTHIALVRNGSTITGYVNGTSVGTSTDSGDITPTTHSLIGSYRGSSSFTNGFVSNARVTKAAVYTSNFTPSTSPLSAIANTSLLLLGTNAGIYDNAMMPDWVTLGNAQISTSIYKYGTGSMYFDGTGDNLSSPPSDLFAFGTGDFTIEFWAYKTANTPGNYDVAFGTGDAGTGNNGYFIELSSTRGFVFAANNAVVTSYAMNPNTSTWKFYTITRSSGTLRLFVDGSVVASTTYTTSIPCTVSVRVGGTGNNFYGYIDDLRVTKGVARYTTTFTPPTSALPNQ